MNTLTEIAAYLFARNGAHIIGTLDSIKLDLQKFYLVMKPDIEYYQGFFPVRKKFNIDVENSSGFHYDFSNNPNNIGYDLSLSVPELGEPPQDILRATPVGQSVLVNQWMQLKRGLGFPGTPGRLITPISVLREYRKPNAYFGMAGRFDITATYNYFFKETRNESDVLEEVEIIGYDGSVYLLDLLSARFLILLGRTRRAFTYNDLQITTDAAELVREGKEELEDARKIIMENQDYHSAYHR